MAAMLHTSSCAHSSGGSRRPSGAVAAAVSASSMTAINKPPYKDAKRRCSCPAPMT
jgi:hypothetical protein